MEAEEAKEKVEIGATEAKSATFQILLKAREQARGLQPRVSNVLDLSATVEAKEAMLASMLRAGELESAVTSAMQTANGYLLTSGFEASLNSLHRMANQQIEEAVRVFGSAAMIAQRQKEEVWGSINLALRVLPPATETLERIVASQLQSMSNFADVARRERELLLESYILAQNRITAPQDGLKAYLGTITLLLEKTALPTLPATAGTREWQEIESRHFIHAPIQPKRYKWQHKLDWRQVSDEFIIEMLMESKDHPIVWIALSLVPLPTLVNWVRSGKDIAQIRPQVMGSLNSLGQRIQTNQESKIVKSGGRPRDEINDWARQQIAQGRDRAEVFREWSAKKKERGDNVDALADPLDSFKKAIRPRAKGTRGKNE